MAEIYSPSPLTLGYQQQTGTFSLRRADKEVSASTLFIFPVSPEEVSIEQPARQLTYQTLGAQTVQDHLGPGVGMIVLAGHTGWRPLASGNSPLAGIDGYLAFQYLRQIVELYQQDCAAGQASIARLELVVSAPEKFGVWRVSVDTLILKRSVREPLLFRYELRLTILEDVAKANESFGIPGRRLPPLLAPANPRPAPALNDLLLTKPFVKPTPAPEGPVPAGALPGVPATAADTNLAFANQLADSFGLQPLTDRMTSVDFDPTGGSTIHQLCLDWYADNADLYEPLVQALNGISDPDTVGACQLRMPIGFWVS